MKITIAQLRNIIKEETDGLLREAGRWNRGSYRVGSSRDPHDTRNYSTRNPDRDYERWFEKGDVPMPGQRERAPSEDPWEDKDWSGGTEHVIHKFFQNAGWDYQSNQDFEKEHMITLIGAVEEDHEDHQALLDAIEWSHKYKANEPYVTQRPITLDRVKEWVEIMLEREEKYGIGQGHWWFRARTES